jgi:hypothetical protein
MIKYETNNNELMLYFNQNNETKIIISEETEASETNYFENLKTELKNIDSNIKIQKLRQNLYEIKIDSISSLPIVLKNLKIQDILNLEKNPKNKEEILKIEEEIKKAPTYEEIKLKELEKIKIKEEFKSNKEQILIKEKEELNKKFPTILFKKGNIELKLIQERSNKYTIVILPKMMKYIQSKGKNVENVLKNIDNNIEFFEDLNKYEIKNITSFRISHFLNLFNAKDLLNPKTNKYYNDVIIKINEDITDPNILNEDITEELIEDFYPMFESWFMKTKHSNFSKEERMTIFSIGRFYYAPLSQMIQYKTNFQQVSNFLDKNFDIEKNVKDFEEYRTKYEENTRKTNLKLYEKQEISPSKILKNVNEILNNIIHKQTNIFILNTLEIKQEIKEVIKTIISASNEKTPDGYYIKEILESFNLFMQMSKNTKTIAIYKIFKDIENTINNENVDNTLNANKNTILPNIIEKTNKNNHIKPQKK